MIMDKKNFAIINIDSICMIYYQYFHHIFHHTPVGLNDKFWISKYEYFSSTTHTDMDLKNTRVQLLL